MNKIYINSKSLYITICVCITLIAYLLLLLDISKKEHESILRETNFSTNKTIDQLLNINDAFFAFNENDFLHACSNLNITSPALLYIYSYNECSSCIMSDIAVLRDFKTRNEDLNVIVLPVDISNRRDTIKSRYDLHSLSYEYFSFESCKMPRYKDHSSRFFIVYNNDKLFMPFIPSKDNSELTILYLNGVLERFF